MQHNKHVRTCFVSFYNGEGMRIGKPRKVATDDPSLITGPDRAAYFTLHYKYQVTIKDGGAVITMTGKRSNPKRYFLTGEVQRDTTHPERSVIRISREFYVHYRPEIDVLLHT